MIDIAIKYFCISLCCLTVFTKILNISIIRRNRFLNVLFSIFFAASSVVLRTYLLDLSILILYALILIYTFFVYKKGSNITITSSVIAFGIAFGLFIISLFLISPIAFITIPKYDGPVFDTITQLLAGIIENILAVLLFKVKRLKNGMPFLLKRGNSDIGVFISITLLISITFNTDNSNYSIRTVLLLVLIISALIIYLWWRKKLYSDYLKKLKENDITALQKTINEQKEEIDKLIASNEEMAKIIHKDNKLIPAMQTAVNDLMARDKTNEQEKLHDQLNSLYNERTAVLESYEERRDSLIKTEVLSTDGLIKYLYNRANDLNEKLEVSVTSSVKYLIENIITEEDLNTLIADLTENAIIATKAEQNRNILLSIGINSDNHYQIDVFDSGPPFADIVLQNIGKIKTTTHENEGGSGIGLVTTFEILNKYNASFKIDQNLNSQIYTKFVRITFDSESSVTLPPFKAL